MTPRTCGAGVLQREVEMAGVPDAAVRELALDPHFEELGFEQIADANGELGDGEDAATAAVVGRSAVVGGVGLAVVAVRLADSMTNG